MATKVFYHVYCNEYTERVVHDQLIKVTFSGLYESVDSIYCFITGDPLIMEQVERMILTFGPKYIISKKVPHDTTYERFTLTEMPAMISPDDNVLYFHTKGITKSNNTNVYDWRTYMEYFLFVKHKTCLRLLNTYDTVGVNYMNIPDRHYSGNFWWCRGAYFLSLDLQKLEQSYWGETYLAPEMFIGTQKPRAYTFCQTDANLYHTPFPVKEYVEQNV